MSKAVLSGCRNHAPRPFLASYALSPVGSHQETIAEYASISDSLQKHCLCSAQHTVQFCCCPPSVSELGCPCAQHDRHEATEGCDSRSSSWRSQLCCKAEEVGSTSAVDQLQHCTARISYLLPAYPAACLSCTAYPDFSNSQCPTNSRQHVHTLGVIQSFD